MSCGTLNHLGRMRRAMISSSSGDRRLRAYSLEVIFVFKTPEELEFDALTVEQWADLEENDQAIYVIHAMELTANMKRQYRRRLK